MAIIRMRDHLYDEIVNYAKEHLPEEACGLLALSLIHISEPTRH